MIRLMVVLLLTLIIPVNGLSVEKFLFKAGYGIKSVALGTVCTKELMETLGPPMATKYNEDTDTLGLLYADYLLIVNRELQVAAIILTQPNYKDNANVGVESPKDDVIVHYGADYELHKYEDKQMFIYKSKGVTFVFQNNKVIAVILYLGLPEKTTWRYEDCEAV